MCTIMYMKYFTMIIFICQNLFNLCVAASLLEALSNVIVNMLSLIPKSMISSFIKVAIFVLLCGIFIVLN